MGYPFKTGPSWDIRDRLLRKLLLPIYRACRKDGVMPGVERLSQHLEKAIQDFVDHYGFQINNFPAWAQSHYPSFDVARGGDQGEDGDYQTIHAEYVEDESNELIGNYYEENWDGQIETACVGAITAEMRALGIRCDPVSSIEALKAAAGDECEKPYDEDED